MNAEIFAFIFPHLLNQKFKKVKIGKIIIINIILGKTKNRTFFVPQHY